MMRFSGAVLVVFAFAATGACKSIQSGPADGPPSSADTGTAARDATRSDAVSEAGMGAADAAPDASAPGLCGRAPNEPPKLSQRNLAQGEPCVHNDECVSGTYCKDPTFVCTPGTRGRGLNGVTPCVTGNDCASSICAENESGAYTCSDACDCKDDCSGELPRCMIIPALGMNMCARAEQ